jgi:CubicO group peptidase (beta-lactamase class C family)
MVRCYWAFLVLLAAPPTAFAQPGAVPKAVLDETIRETLKAWEVPGVAAAIVYKGRVVYLQGFGVKELGRPGRVTPDSIFPLASCSKSFTSAALALLVDEGKAGWDDPVRKHLPWFHLADPLADANVTLRDLLCHRTGVDSHDLLWYRAPWGLDEMIRKAGKLEPSASFRSAFQYQTVMFAAAGQAAGAAAGTTWSDLVRKQLLTPLGMRRTTLTTAEARALQPADNLAGPHRRTAEGKIEPIPWYDLNEPNPAGSVHSTARDLANWLQFQLDDGMFGGRRLVKAESLAETRTGQMLLRREGATRDLNPDSFQLSYGMGWVIQDYRGELLVMHGGAINGFRAQLTLAPRAGLGIALLNNLDNTLMNLALSNTLVDLYLGLPAKNWNGFYLAFTRNEEKARAAHDKAFRARRRPNTHPSRALAAYAGTYEDPAYGTARVTLEDGKLVWQWSTFRCVLEHFHYDTFDAPHPHLVNAQVVFALNADGDVSEFEALGRRFKRVR